MPGFPGDWLSRDSAGPGLPLAVAPPYSEHPPEEPTRRDPMLMMSWNASPNTRSGPHVRTCSSTRRTWFADLEARTLGDIAIRSGPDRPCTRSTGRARARSRGRGRPDRDEGRGSRHHTVLPRLIGLTRGLGEKGPVAAMALPFCGISHFSETTAQSRAAWRDLLLRSERLGSAVPRRDS
jgi:hypothetical protein